MACFIAEYVNSRLRCAFAKGDYGRGEGFLHPIELFLRKVSGNSYLLVLVDGFTKFATAKPTRTVKTRVTVAKLKEIMGEYGYPRRIISDRGLTFSSREFWEFTTEKGIRHVKNAILTPRANGQKKVVNRKLIGALATSEQNETRWEETLPDIAWGLNNTIYTSTQYFPVELMNSHSSRGMVADLGVGEGELAITGGLADSPTEGRSGTPAQSDSADGVVRDKKREKGQGRREGRRERP